MSGYVPVAAVLTHEVQDDGPGRWVLLHANGDVARAREFAASWAREHPGRQAHVLVHADSATAEMAVKWSKP